MLRFSTANKGQALMGEYVVVIFLVLGTIGAMTVYFRRAIHARIHDAHLYAVRQVEERTEGNYIGDLMVQYEPYYTNRVTFLTRNADESKSLSSTATQADSFSKTLDQTTAISTTDAVAPARDFGRTEAP